MKVVDIALGSEGEVTVDLVGGIVIIELTEKMVGMPGGLKLQLPLPYYLEVLAVKAGNPIVTGVVKVIESVLIAIP